VGGGLLPSKPFMGLRSEGNHWVKFDRVRGNAVLTVGEIEEANAFQSTGQSTVW